MNDPKEKDTDPVDILLEKAVEALEKEDYNRAIEYIRKAIDLAPFRQDLKDLLAHALDRKPFAPSPPTPRMEGEEEEKTEDREEERPITRQTPKKAGISIGLWLFVFSVLCIASLAFFFFFSNAIQIFVSNISSPKEEIRLSPTDREAATLFKTAEFLQEQKRFSEAIDTLQKAIDKNPSDKKQYEQKLAELYFNLGEYYEGKNDYPRAITSYEKAVQLNPNSSDYYYGLGWTNYIQGRKYQNRNQRHQPYYDKSLEALKKSLELDPDNLVAKKALARLYIARNETTKAAEMYRQIIRQSPDSSEADQARRALKSMGFKE